MKNLFDMSRQELAAFLNRLINNINAKNNLEEALQNSSFVQEAHQKVAEQFCQKYDEDLDTFEGMLHDNDSAFLQSHFYKVFKEHPDSKEFSLLTEKIGILEQTKDELAHQQENFSAGNAVSPTAYVVLSIIMVLLFFLSVHLGFPFIVQIIFLIALAFCLYRVYSQRKYWEFEEKIKPIQHQINDTSAERNEVALPYLKQMFQNAVKEWQASPEYIKTIDEADAKTAELQKQLDELDLSDIAIIPEKFSSLAILEKFYNYIQEGRADSWKECVNLYHQELQFDESRRHYQEQEEHNREESRLHQQELSEQRRQSVLASQQLDEAREQTRVQNSQLNENRKQTTLAGLQLGEAMKQTYVQNKIYREARQQTNLQGQQLNEARMQTTLQGQQLNEARTQSNFQRRQLTEEQRQTDLGKARNSKLNDIHTEQKEHNRWAEKGFRTKQEEEDYRFWHPQWDKSHPRNGDPRNRIHK